MTREELVQALALIDEPEMPVDGDCLRLSDRITQTLQGRGWPARTANVMAWADFAAKLIAFGHFATEVDGWIVDFTARQFSDKLPARWIVPADRYPRLLAGMARVDEVTLHWEPGAVHR